MGKGLCRVRGDKPTTREIQKKHKTLVNPRIEAPTCAHMRHAPCLAHLAFVGSVSVLARDRHLKKLPILRAFGGFWGVLGCISQLSLGRQRTRPADIRLANLAG